MTNGRAVCPPRIRSHRVANPQYPPQKFGMPILSSSQCGMDLPQMTSPSSFNADEGERRKITPADPSRQPSRLGFVCGRLSRRPHLPRRPSAAANLPVPRCPAPPHPIPHGRSTRPQNHVFPSKIRHVDFFTPRVPGRPGDLAGGDPHDMERRCRSRRRGGAHL
jgi:hypothetical protein